MAVLCEYHGRIVQHVQLSHLTANSLLKYTDSLSVLTELGSIERSPCSARTAEAAANWNARPALCHWICGQTILLANVLHKSSSV